MAAGLVMSLSLWIVAVAHAKTPFAKAKRKIADLEVEEVRLVADGGEHVQAESSEVAKKLKSHTTISMKFFTAAASRCTLRPELDQALCQCPVFATSSFVQLRAAV